MAEFPRHWQQGVGAYSTGLPQVEPQGPGPSWEGFAEVLKSLTLDQLTSLAESARKITHDVGSNLGVSGGVRPTNESSWGDALNVGLALTAFHGSPYRFSKFDIGKIGTGEGVQAFGRGLYFSERPGVAKWYREKLTGGKYEPIPVSASSRVTTLDIAQKAREVGREDVAIAARWLQDYGGDFDKAASKMREHLTTDYYRPKPNFEGAIKVLEDWQRKNLFRRGGVYEVNLPVQKEELLDWDAPFSQQPESIQKSVREMWKSRGFDKWQMDSMEKRAVDGRSIYNSLTGISGGEENARQAFNAAGIKGIRYKDAFSRGASVTDPTENYVMFDDKGIEILKTMGLAGAVGASAQKKQQESTKQVGIKP